MQKFPNIAIISTNNGHAPLLLHNGYTPLESRASKRYSAFILLYIDIIMGIGYYELRSNSSIPCGLGFCILKVKKKITPIWCNLSSDQPVNLRILYSIFFVCMPTFQKVKNKERPKMNRSSELYIHLV